MYAQDKERVVVQAKPSDVSSIDNLISTLYEVISGEAGTDRDWDRFISLWHPEANLSIVTANGDGTSSQVVLDIYKFMELSSAYSGKRAFYEVEIARKTEEIGHLANVISTYEIRTSKDSEAELRGVNLFHLYHDGERWWIMNCTWQNEGNGMTIPKKYLK